MGEKWRKLSLSEKIYFPRPPRQSDRLINPIRARYLNKNGWSFLAEVQEEEEEEEEEVSARTRNNIYRYTRRYTGS